MLNERQRDRKDEPRVDPWGCADEGLAIRESVEGVEHLNGDEDGEGDGHGAATSALCIERVVVSAVKAVLHPP